MRKAAIVTACCAMLSACGDSWLGDDGPKPLPGKRISVLSHSKSIEVDVGNSLRIALPPPEPVADWPQAGGFPGHAMHHLALTGPVERVWTARMGSGATKRGAFMSQPIVVGGKIFALDSESVLAAFDLKDGDRLWRVDLAPLDADAGSFGGGVAYDEGRLYVTTGFGQILAVDPAEGRILWRQSLLSPARGAPTVRAGRLFLVTVDNEALALSAEDGHQLWHHAGISEMAALLGSVSPAVDGNTVLVPYTSGELFALRMENGTVLWNDLVSSIRRTDQVAELTDIRGLPVIDRGRVFVAGNSEIFTAIDLRSGRRVWDRDVGSVETPWVAGDYVYLLSNNAELVCFDGKTGKARWVTALPRWKNAEEKTGLIIWTGPLLASDRLILASSSGEVMSVSPYTGAILSKDDLPAGVTIRPLVASDTLILVTEDGQLVAYR
ncbi:MAG TPA: PQQ-binding-like beta-propeller repeat protein [Rhodospirillaceae bacterium]|nr:PQQ-binding-like beta-propeller repeat protein [Rhodospirillaceae bacterium]